MKKDELTKELRSSLLKLFIELDMIAFKFRMTKEDTQITNTKELIQTILKSIQKEE